MIRVTSTLIVHRPERVLYYLPEATEEIRKYIGEGCCPDVLKKYQYTFGTYDDAGVFYLPADLQKETGRKNQRSFRIFRDSGDRYSLYCKRISATAWFYGKTA